MSDSTTIPDLFAEDKPAKPAAPEQAPWGMLRQASGKPAGGVGTSPGEVGIELLKGLVMAPQVPSQAALTTLGTPMRMSMSEMSHPELKGGQDLTRNLSAAAGPAGWLASMLNPQSREQAGHDVYAAFHPNDPRIEETALQKTGVSKLLPTAGQAPHIKNFISAYAMSKGVPKAKADSVADIFAPFIQKAQDLAVRTGFETAADPLSYSTAVSEELSKLAFRKYDEALHDAIGGKYGPAGTWWMKWGAGDVRERAYEYRTGKTGQATSLFSPEQRAKIRTYRSEAETQERVANDKIARMVKRDKPLNAPGVVDLSTLPLDNPARRELMREAFVYGKDRQTQRAISNQGFAVNPDDPEEMHALFHGPKGYMDYDVRDLYNPQVKPDGTVGGVKLHVDYHPAGEGFMKHQYAQLNNRSLPERVEMRLRSGRAVIRERQIADRLKTNMNLDDKSANELAQRLTVPTGPLGALSAWRTRAMLFFGLPHARNVGVAGWIAGGSELIADATRMFATGVPQHLKDELAKGGAAHFGESSPMATLLNDWDTAVRAGRLKQVKREMPKASLEEQLDRVNQDIGTYARDTMPGAAHWSKVVGGQFPGWRLYNVPGMFLRATLRNPGRMRRLFSAEQNVSDEYLPEGWRLTLGGPADEGAEAMASGPLGAFKYLTSPSVIGPLNQIPQVLRSAAALKQGNMPTPSDALSIGEFFAGGTPPTMLAGEAVQEGLNPYGQPGPAGLRLLLDQLGPYFTRETPYGMLRRATKQGSASSESTGSTTIPDLFK